MMSRRTFSVRAAAAVGARFVPVVATKPAGRQVLTLVCDKSRGVMRATVRIVG